ncbi:MAG: SMP-30/gluconolactonase/LRE family protein, partial [Candidatus Bipolaricaulota bacterium]
MSKIWLIGLATGLGALAGYLLFWPVSISPVRWAPPEAPTLTGIYEPNEALVAMDRLEVGLGPESVAVDQAGVVHCGLEDGSIVRWAEGVGEAEALLNIGGRPLGMAFDVNGNLIVCDLYGRLLVISEKGDIEELATQVDDKPLGLINDLDIGADGTVYFSESSTKTTDTT